MERHKSRSNTFEAFFGIRNAHSEQMVLRLDSWEFNAAVGNIVVQEDAVEV